MSEGRGKIIVVGEHGVVYGRPAIAASIARGVGARARPSEDVGLDVERWGVHLSLPRDAADSDLGRAFAALLESYAGQSGTPRLRVEVRPDLPPGAGLGCSAAMGVAIVRALDEATGSPPRSSEEVAERSLIWERVFHGNPSGIDSAMAAGAGIAIFEKGKALIPIRARRPLYWVIGDSGEASATRLMVEEVARQHVRDPARIEKTFDAMEALVRNARLAIEQGDTKGLGQLLDMNQLLLGGLMVSTQRLEEMCDAARRAGALGAKLTGAGGGGCMIALAKDPEDAARIRDALGLIAKDAFVVDTGA